jgi:RNA polymerase sigma factor (sigma-70 family)
MQKFSEDGFIGSEDGFIIGGDSEVFEAFCRYWRPRLLAYVRACFRHPPAGKDHEDFVQDVLLWVAQDFRRGQHMGNVFLKLRNLVLDGLRQQPHARDPISIDGDEDSKPVHDVPERGAMGRPDMSLNVSECLSAISKCLRARLNRRELEVVILRVSGLGFTEIGMIVGVSESAACRRYNQAEDMVTGCMLGWKRGPEIDISEGIL